MAVSKQCRSIILLTSLALLLLSSLANAQASGTPSNLRVKTDANGYLVASAVAVTAPISNPTTFTNTRLRTDANGYLLVTVGDSASFNNPVFTGQWTVNGSLCSSGQILQGGSPTVCTSSPTASTSLTSPLILGGTAVGSTLSLQSTSGVGTTDAIIFKVGNNGATEAARILDSGFVGIGTNNAVSIFHVQVNQSAFGVGSLIRYENTNTNANAVILWDMLAGSNLVRMTVPSQNAAVQVAVVGSTVNTMDFGFGPSPASIRWNVKSGAVLGAPAGNLYAGIDNQYDIGDSGATGRPRNIYLGGTATAEHIASGAVTAVANVGASSCGTSAASIAGTDNAGNITVGATSGTQCRIQFTVAAPTRRNCTVTDETTGNLMRTTYVDTTHTDVIGVMVAADILSYVCFAR